MCMKRLNSESKCVFLHNYLHKLVLHLPDNYLHVLQDL